MHLPGPLHQGQQRAQGAAPPAGDDYHAFAGATLLHLAAGRLYGEPVPVMFHKKGRIGLHIFRSEGITARVYFCGRNKRCQGIETGMIMGHYNGQSAYHRHCNCWKNPGLIDYTIKKQGRCADRAGR